MANAKIWNIYAKIYNLLVKVTTKQRSEIFKRLALTKGDKVYIAGCGTGLDLAYFPDGCEVTAVDFSTSMVARTQQELNRLQQQGLAITADIRQGSAENSELPDNSVDVVLLHLILAVVPDSQGLLAEAVRIVRPGGIISIWDKFAPTGDKVSLWRRLGSHISGPIGTKIDLQVDPLLAPYPLHVCQRNSMYFGQMQHLVVRKEREYEKNAH